MASDSPAVQTRCPSGTVQNMNGSVFLIGAGPGDPGLLTIRGAEVLRQSDVVLYDGLCNPELLAQAPQALQICVGKHGRSRIWTQDEIITEMVRYAKEGKTVSRLKGGDPAIFARTAEEIDALAGEGIKYEVVPGITTALASGSYAGIPITHRKYASAVALITGHEQFDKSESALDWEALAKFPGTLVIYMGVTTADAWTNNLIMGGLSPNTSVAIIRRCSLSDQTVVRCKLKEIPTILGSGKKTRPPVITIIGKVADIEAHELQQFSNLRPLSGQTILVTRPVEQAESLAKPLRELGAEVLIHPMIQISPPEKWDEVDHVIDARDHWDWIIFCSQNGVRFFMKRLYERNLDSRALNGFKIGCVGAQTANALKEHGIVSDIVPEDFSGEHLAQTLIHQSSDKKFLIIRANRGNNRIADLLTESGADVTQVASYQHTDVTNVCESVLNRMKQGEIQWVTAMSSETVRNLHRCFGESLTFTNIACISPLTANVARQLKLEVAAEATEYNSRGLIQSILEAIQ